MASKFDRAAYLEANPSRRYHTIEGVSYGVDHDAVLTMLSVFESLGLKDVSEVAVNKLILSKAREVFREFAFAVIKEPAVYRNPDEAAAEGGLAPEEFNPVHLNELIRRLMGEWEVAGKSAARTFRDDGAEHRAGPTGPGVQHPTAPVADS